MNAPPDLDRKPPLKERPAPEEEAWSLVTKNRHAAVELFIEWRERNGLSMARGYEVLIKHGYIHGRMDGFPKSAYCWEHGQYAPPALRALGLAVFLLRHPKVPETFLDPKTPVPPAPRLEGQIERLSRWMARRKVSSTWATRIMASQGLALSGTALRQWLAKEIEPDPLTLLGIKTFLDRDIPVGEFPQKTRMALNARQVNTILRARQNNLRVNRLIDELLGTVGWDRLKVTERDARREGLSPTVRRKLEALERQKVRQREVADQLGVSEAAVSRVWRGNRHSPGLEAEWSQRDGEYVAMGHLGEVARGQTRDEALRNARKALEAKEGAPARG